MRRPFLLGASLGRDSDAYAGEPATRGTGRGAGCYLLRCRAQCLRDGGDSGAAIADRPGIASPALHILTSWYVIGICRLLFVVEFFADKIPAFHLIWDALHTDKSAAGGARPGGLIASAAHWRKDPVRAAVTPSPGPLSNISLSLGEDVFAIFLTWFATQHHYLASAIVRWLLIVIVVVIRWVGRALGALFRGAHK